VLKFRARAVGPFKQLFHSIRKRRAGGDKTPDHLGYIADKTDDEQKLFDVCFANVLEIESVRRQYTTRYIRIHLDVLLSSSLAADIADPTEAFKRWIARLEAPTGETKLFFPVYGIDLRIDSVPIGKAILRHFHATEPRADVPPIIGRDLTVEELAMLDAQEERVRIEMRINADHDKAIELGQIEAERITDALTFLATLEIAPDFVGVQLGSPETREPRDGAILVISARTWETRSTIPRPVSDLQISGALGPLLRKHGIDGLEELLIRNFEELSEFERALLDAIHWFSVAVNERRIEIRFMSLVTAGELFFSHERAAITSNFSDGVAFLLAGDEDQEARENLKKEIEEAYDARSRISHSGSRAEEDERFVSLRRLIRELIRKLLSCRSEFHTLDNVLTWLRKKRLS